MSTKDAFAQSMRARPRGKVCPERNRMLIPRCGRQGVNVLLRSDAVVHKAKAQQEGELAHLQRQLAANKRGTTLKGMERLYQRLQLTHCNLMAV